MNYEVRLRLKALAADFYHYLQVFDEQVPFGKPGQREYHSETIAARKESWECCGRYRRRALHATSLGDSVGLGDRIPRLAS